MKTYSVRCPYCLSPFRQIKWGHTSAGSQKYRCHGCRRVYTPAPRFNGHPPDVRRTAVLMHQRGLPFRCIAQRLGVHHQSVVNWIRRHYQEVAGSPTTLSDPPTGRADILPPAD